MSHIVHSMQERHNLKQNVFYTRHKVTFLFNIIMDEVKLRESLGQEKLEIPANLELEHMYVDIMVKWKEMYTIAIIWK